MTKTYGTAGSRLTGTLSGFLMADGGGTYSRRLARLPPGAPTISATPSPAAALGKNAIIYNTAGSLSACRSAIAETRPNEPGRHLVHDLRNHFATAGGRGHTSPSGQIVTTSPERQQAVTAMR
jgi:hypothetical protein